MPSKRNAMDLPDLPRLDGREKKRAPRNRTLTATDAELAELRLRLLTPDAIRRDNFIGRTILGDCFTVVPKLPPQAVDLLILDPPYNLTKKFGHKTFSRVPVDHYTDWLRRLFQAL